MKIIVVLDKKEADFFRASAEVADASLEEVVLALLFARGSKERLKEIVSVEVEE